MKIKAIILLLLAVSLIFAADCTFLMVPAVSSASLPLVSGSALGQPAPDPVAIVNFPSNITIKGNMNITGNSVVDLAGVSSSNPLSVSLYGSIFINDNATLVLKYATLYLMGATKPYGCNITLSSSQNSHPRLDIGPAVTIIAYTTGTFNIGSITVHGHKIPVTATASYGAAIFAYGNGEINANGLTFYRAMLYNFSLGGPTLIECRGESSVNLTSVQVDSVLGFDAARVTIYTGSGTTKSGKVFNGVVLGFYNASTANLYDVSFQSIVASDETQMFLDACTETGNITTATGRSRVYFTDKTILYPSVNAMGDSYVSLSSSTLTTTHYGTTVVSLHQNATFAIVQGSTVTGWVLAFDNSRVVLNDSGKLSAQGSIGIVSRDSSSVSIFNSSLNSFPTPVIINTFDGSRLSIVNSTTSGCSFGFFNDTAVYISGSRLESEGTGLRIVSQDNANVTVVGSLINADYMGMSDNASLSMKSSTAWMISCLNSSQVSIGNGSLVSELSVRDSAKVEVYNSTVSELSLTESNVNGSVSGLTSFVKNSTLALSGSTIRISLLNTKVNGLSFSFSGLSNVTISNSTLSNLSLQDSSVVTLNNASVSASPYVLGNSKVFEYSSLRVHCVDYFGNPLNNSVVTISGFPGVTPREITDKNGLASFVIFSEFDNATANFPFGTVTVKGVFGGVSTSQDVTVASINKEVTLSLPLPSWWSYILPLVILVVIVALLTVMYYAIKGIRRKRE